MEKKLKRLWIVETATITDAHKQRRTTSYFSTKAKAMVHIEWLKGCAVNNKAKELPTEDDGDTFRFLLTNGEIWVISLIKEYLDVDDLYQ